MALLIPGQQQSLSQVSGLTDTSAGEFGTVVTASSTSHTFGTATQIVASTDYDSFGIVVGLGNVATATSTNSRMLVSICTASDGTNVIIPNLLAGQAGQSVATANVSTGPIYYFFPIYIPSGTSLYAKCQALISSDTVNVSMQLIQHQVPGAWYGSRVTDYGVSTSTSTGTSHTPGAAGSYATTTQLTASTTNRIRAMQIGIDLLTDTTGSNARGLVQIAAGGSTNYVVSGLPFREAANLESVDPNDANFILSQMMFDIPAGSYLGVGAQESTAEARGFAIYGVD